MAELKKQIEAILFSAGRAIELDYITRLCRTRDTELVLKALQELKDKYDKDGSSMMLMQDENAWKLTVREQYLPTVQKIMPHTEMTRTIIETLAVIAWKHPVLQSEVVDIRSNKAYDHVKELVRLGFITKERKGRSYLIKVTQKFLDYFDLPDKKSAKQIFKNVESQEGAKDVLASLPKVWSDNEVPAKDKESKSDRQD